MSDNSFVVGIGASAGGLEAIQEFFDNMGSSTGLSFVVIQHLSPDFKSMMDELLKRNTRMEIHVAEHGMEIKPDSIYLVPPKNNMTIEGGCLLLAEQDRGVTNFPINEFFASMAKECGERCVAIVLSGTGSDGARGILDVCESGGLVLAQDPKHAKFDGMPKSAIATKVVNKVLAASAMPELILRYVEEPNDLKSHSETLSSYEGFTGRFAEIFKVIFDRHGLNLEDYKSSTINRRIIRRIKTLMLNSADEYLELLREDDEEKDILTRDLIIGVTTFFRDEMIFGYVADVIIAKLFKESDDPIRIWVCACSTGEEAYSIAMLLEDYKERHGLDKQYKIFATDLMLSAINFASAGVYPEESFVETRRRDLIDKYFNKTKQGLQISQKIRNNIVFTVQNVVTEPPFTRLDLVSCRNLLIYLRPPIQKQVLANFHFALRKDGILFLGPSEHLGDLEDEFHPVNSKWKIYSKKRDVRIPINLLAATLDKSFSLTTPFQGTRHFEDATRNIASFEYDAILRELISSGLVLNNKNEVTHVFGEARSLLSYPEGRIGAVRDIFQLVEKPFKVPLNTALTRARKEHSRVVFERVDFAGDGENLHRLIVKPLGTNKKPSEHTLVLFEKYDEGEAEVLSSQSIDLNEQSEKIITDLERELQFTKESLQATIEEVETTNEELQSTNEELLASNEELQSTNEELQSVNEELYTVNSEHQEKIQELLELNNDMDNLLASTEIGTIFVNQDCEIRKFTPGIRDLFYILPSDIGRPIKHFTHTISYDDLLSDIESVISLSRGIEKEVRDKDGRFFLLRITPYKSEGPSKGAVLSFVDISQIKRAESELFSQREALDQAVIVAETDVRGDITYVNEKFIEISKYTRGELMGQNHRIVNSGQHPREFFVDLWETISRGRSWRGEICNKAKDGSFYWVDTLIYPKRDMNGNIEKYISIRFDITERVLAERALKKEQARMIHSARMASVGEMAAGIAHEINNPLTVIKGRMKSLRNIMATSDPVNVDDLKNVIDKVDITVDRISSIIKGLRTFSRGDEQSDIKAVKVEELLQDTFDFCRSRIEEEGIGISVDNQCSNLQVRCQPLQISQILLNLLQNSRDAISGTPDAWIRIKAWEQENNLYVSVTDSGPGISEAVRKNIFEPFYTTKELGKGTGLGLSLSREIIEGQDGSLDLDESNKNTCFILRVPLAK